MTSTINRVILIILIFTIILVFIGCSINKTNINKINLSEMYYKGEIVNVGKSINSKSYPQSYSPHTRYFFSVDKDSTFISIKLFDLNSNMISNVFVGNLDSGRYEIKKLESNLNAGAYIFLFEKDGVISKKMFLQSLSDNSIKEFIR